MFLISANLEVDELVLIASVTIKTSSVDLPVLALDELFQYLLILTKLPGESLNFDLDESTVVEELYELP